jgi:hypothetical protein
MRAGRSALAGPAPLALLYGHSVVGGADKANVQKTGAGRRIYEGFATPVAGLCGVCYRELVGVVRVYDVDYEGSRWFGIGTRQVVRNAK